MRLNVRTVGEDGRAVEWRMEGGARLRYEIASTDSATYTEPLTLTKHFVWVPGLEIRLYGCTEE